jgi:hypothetical protein
LELDWRKIWVVTQTLEIPVLVDFDVDLRFCRYKKLNFPKSIRTINGLYPVHITLLNVIISAVR